MCGDRHPEIPGVPNNITGKSIQEKSMTLQNEIAKMNEALSLNVRTTENEIMKKLRKDIRVGVSSIKDNLAKLNEK